MPLSCPLCSPHSYNLTVMPAPDPWYTQVTSGHSSSKLKTVSASSHVAVSPSPAVRSPPMARRLRATPSCGDQAWEYQRLLMKEVDKVFEAHQESRTSIVSDVIRYQGDFEGLESLSKCKDQYIHMLTASGLDPVAPADMVKLVFAAERGSVIGIRHLCPAQFKYGLDSMWRGNPSNHTIRKLSRSIIAVGFVKTASSL